MENKQDEQQPLPDEVSPLHRTLLKVKSVLGSLFWSDKGTPRKRGIALVAALVLSYLFKKKVYDRLMPSSEVINLILKQDVKKVVFGSLFLLCYLKNPQPGQGSYFLTSRSLINSDDLL